MIDSDKLLRDNLVQLLKGGHAHTTFDQAVRGFPVERAGERPPGSPHSAWELLEHMRLAQKDILEFSKSADYVSPKWPEGYWPKNPGPADPGDWKKSVDEFHADLKTFEAMLRDATIDLYARFPWGDGQTLLREALVLADHNSYHVGQLVLVRRLMGVW